LTPTPPVESEEIVTEEVAVRVPVVNLPMDDEAKKESTILPRVEKKVVEVALVTVAYEVLRPPRASTESTVEEATLKSRKVPEKPEAASAAKMVPLVPWAIPSLANGEVVPIPTEPPVKVNFAFA